MNVGIIGGGITGLALTHALARRGIQTTLLERSPEIGGVIRTIEREGDVLELGPQRTRLVPPVRRLVEELDLGDELLEAAPGSELFVWTRGRLRRVPRSVGGLATGDLLTPGGRIRMAAEPLTAGLDPDESVAAYFTRKCGAEAYRTLFGPLISATFASDPARMRAGQALPMLLEPLGVRRSLLAAARRWRPTGAAPACTFRHGMATLPRALAAKHAARLRLGVGATAVRGTGTGVEIRTDGGEALTVDHVVLTCEAHAAAALLASSHADVADRLAGLSYNEVCVVPLRVENTPAGFGFQVAFGEDWQTRGVTWNAALFGRTQLATAYLGGGRAPEIADWSDADVGRVAAREFEEIHGISAEPLAVARPALPAYDETWSRLDGLVLPERVTIAASYTGRLGISGRIAEVETLAERLSSAA